VAEEKSIKYIIELLAQNKGALEAAAALQRVGKAGTEAKSSLLSLSKVGRDLESMLIRSLSVAAIARFGYVSITEFAKIERAFGGLRLQLQQLGPGASAALPQVKALLQSLHDAGDGLITETLPAFRQFLGLTHSVPAAMSLTTLASRMSESGMGDYTKAVNDLSSLLSGRASRAIKEWGINVSEAADGTVDSDVALKALNATFTEAMAKQEDMQDRLDRLSARFANLKQSIGFAVAATVDWLENNMPSPFDDPVAGAADWLKKKRRSPFDDLPAPIPGQPTPEQARQAGLQTGESYDAGMEEAFRVAAQKRKAEEAKEAAEAAAKAAKQAKEDEDQERDLESQLAIARYEIRQEAARKQEQLRKDQLKLDEEAAQQERDIEDANAQHRIGLLGEELAAFEEYSQARLAKEEELLRAQAEMEVAEALERGEDTTNITLRFMRRIDRARVDSSRQALRQAREEAQAKIAAQLQVAGAAAALAETAFGRSKAVAIAQTIISTAAAVMHSMYDPGGYAGIALAAIATAMGAVQIAKIRSTNPEGAFDDPSRDRMLMVDTRRSLSDFVRLNSEAMVGVLRRLPETIQVSAPAAAFSAGGAGGMVVNIHGNVFGGNAGMRDLARKLRRASRLDQPRLVQ